MPELEADLRSRFSGDPDYVARWAALPRGSRPLDNPLGGAPGFRIANTWVLPGLPSEMGAMFDRYADELRGDRPIETWRRRLATRESTIASALEQATASWPGVSVGSYPSFDASGPEVEVVLKSADPDGARSGEIVARGGARPADLTGTVGWWQRSSRRPTSPT